MQILNTSKNSNQTAVYILDCFSSCVVRPFFISSLFNKITEYEELNMMNMCSSYTWEICSITDFNQLFDCVWSWRITSMFLFFQRLWIITREMNWTRSWQGWGATFEIPHELTGNTFSKHTAKQLINHFIWQKWTTFQIYWANKVLSPAHFTLLSLFRGLRWERREPRK